MTKIACPATPTNPDPQKENWDSVTSPSGRSAQLIKWNMNLRKAVWPSSTKTWHSHLKVFKFYKKPSWRHFIGEGGILVSNIAYSAKHILDIKPLAGPLLPSRPSHGSSLFQFLLWENQQNRQSIYGKNWWCFTNMNILLYSYLSSMTLHTSQVNCIYARILSIFTK